MVGFNKDKILVTLSNVLLYIGFIIVYYNIIIHHSLNYKYGVISILLLTFSILTIALFLFIRSRYYRQKNISLTQLNKKNQLMIKMFLIFELSAIFIGLICIILGFFNKNINDISYSITYNTALGLIILLTIIASFFETLLRVRLTYDKNNYQTKLEIKN